jgi:hypothetical protein
MPKKPSRRETPKVDPRSAEGEPEPSKADSAQKKAKAEELRLMILRDYNRTLGS